MDLKDLYFFIQQKNILELNNLSHTFFTEPDKKLTEETCLNQILRILSTETIVFPEDSSDVFDMIIHKNEKIMVKIYKKVKTSEKIVKTPYISPSNDSFINLICFMKAYASHTYSHRGSFKEYFKDVFDVFYNILI